MHIGRRKPGSTSPSDPFVARRSNTHPARMAWLDVLGATLKREIIELAIRYSVIS